MDGSIDWLLRLAALLLVVAVGLIFWAGVVSILRGLSFL